METSQSESNHNLAKKQRIEKDIAASYSSIAAASNSIMQTTSSATLKSLWKPMEKQNVDDAVGDFFFANGIPFNVARSPYFRNMFQQAVEFVKDTPEEDQVEYESPHSSFGHDSSAFTSPSALDDLMNDVTTRSLQELPRLCSSNLELALSIGWFSFARQDELLFLLELVIPWILSPFSIGARSSPYLFIALRLQSLRVMSSLLLTLLSLKPRDCTILLALSTRIPSVVLLLRPRQRYACSAAIFKTRKKSPVKGVCLPGSLLLPVGIGIPDWIREKIPSQGGSPFGQINDFLPFPFILPLAHLWREESFKERVNFKRWLLGLVEIKGVLVVESLPDGEATTPSEITPFPDRPKNDSSYTRGDKTCAKIFNLQCLSSSINLFCHLIRMSHAAIHAIFEDWTKGMSVRVLESSWILAKTSYKETGLDQQRGHGCSDR
eukprot:Gb_41673 [translate_table: standard]